MSNFIHPTAVIGPNCRINGSENYIGPYCVLDNCSIGSGNRFESHVCIGSWPEMRPRTSPQGLVYIVNDCEFREFVTVNSGTIGATCIGSNVLMLRGSHVGHDAIIETDVTLSCNVMIGGHSFVGRGANVGLGVVVHQKRAIGAYAMVGMGSVVTKHVGVGAKAFGNPCVVRGVNDIGLSRSGNPDLSFYEMDFEQVCKSL